ncbi:hypothetical protein QU481_19625 [Crenobacter sp. SG2303]|uniref:Uncharacterized protein n=1 Tax=Crenobacter oryzisoli TaxID=3056844 RepID=A0ABT7XTD6_9NEIS|nr:hypothetical protein [Crenobacter sp. SG2303]MDN0077058.1 hypothetical protein [Crenobacter sp. SG2303]
MQPPSHRLPRLGQVQPAAAAPRQHQVKQAGREMRALLRAVCFWAGSHTS